MEQRPQLLTWPILASMKILKRFFKPSMLRFQFKSWITERTFENDWKMNLPSKNALLGNVLLRVRSDKKIYGFRSLEAMYDKAKRSFHIGMIWITLLDFLQHCIKRLRKQSEIWRLDILPPPFSFHICFVVDCNFELFFGMDCRI